jgi:hypothetical protein
VKSETLTQSIEEELAKKTPSDQAHKEKELQLQRA